MIELYKEDNRRGFALGVVLILIGCFGIWITSVSWTMMNNRSQYQRLLKGKQAYFLARSGMEHLLLKLKVMQRQCPHVVRALEAATDTEKQSLFMAFTEDVVVPVDSEFTGESNKYGITEFDVESVDLDQGRLILRIGVKGQYGGFDNKVSRLMHISR